MNKLIVANWKMNPKTVSEAIELAVVSDRARVVVAPPFPFLAAVGGVIGKAALGAQDVSSELHGPFTGQVGASQLASVGVKYVIVGHSERRALGETDEVIGRKVLAVTSANLTPILCVGETAAERRAGVGESVVIKQLHLGLSRLKHHAVPIFVAYEPVWAISTSSAHAIAMTPDKAQYAAHGIRRAAERMGFSVKVLYGGSVDEKNATTFLSQSDISGALVGGASIKPQSITTIIASLTD